jgi:flavorubredoxin
MEAKVDEIADGVYRVSAYVPEIAPPQGFTYNHFLVLGDEPLVFHTGLRRMFPSILAAAEKVLPALKLRWICFGHYEADECGAMNEWRRRPSRRSHTRPNRVPRVGQRHGRPDAPNSGR